MYSSGAAQSYFAYQESGADQLLVKITLDCNCPGCCIIEEIGPTRQWQSRLTMSPEGRLYGIDEENDLYFIDTLTGASTFHFHLPDNLSPCLGLVTLGGGIFYSMIEQNPQEADTLIEINVPLGTINQYRLNWRGYGDLTVYNGEIYYLSNVTAPAYLIKLVKLNIAFPDQSDFLMLLYPMVRGQGISATRFCNTMIGSDLAVDDELYLINTADGTMYSHCNVTGIQGLTSMQEYLSPTICTELDLDCDDSSLAVMNDFQSTEINCFQHLAPVSDEDITMFYDDDVTEMRVFLTGLIPDGAMESLELIGGSSVGVDVFGEGTQMIRLLDNGWGSSDDYKFLLNRIFYQNLSDYPTAGVRTVEVQSTTEAGTISSIAIAFIPVVEIPKHPVNLGPDLVLCAGEETSFDSGSPGVLHEWSTGSHDQIITVHTAGIYSVTVTGGGLCPNQDTIKLDYKPNITVSLTGDDQLCDAGTASLEIQGSPPFSLDMTLTATPGTSILVENVAGIEVIPVPLTSTTIFVISNVTSGIESCIEVLDSVHTIYLYHSYELVTKDTICDGDSVLIGTSYKKVSGIYDESYVTNHGCDSFITTALTVLPVIKIFQNAVTCNAANAGVVVTYLPSAGGCDTVVTTTTSYVPADTSSIALISCKKAEEGVVVQTLTNQQGCDSLLITTTAWVPPSDTTFLFQSACDISMTGVFQQFLFAVDGCDSLTITTVTLAALDTTYQNSSSCDPAMIGVHQLVLQGNDGCDSLVITTTIAGIPDTTLAFSTSCDQGSLGVFETHHMNQALCDSLVILTVTFSAHDSTFISGFTCDPAEVSVNINTYINRFGCDSIVTETVVMSPPDSTFINGTTCIQAEVGVFATTLINQSGCDSIIIETITLLPSNTTFLTSTTCHSSETGVFTTILQNQDGCDSTVTLTVSLVAADTTLLTFMTCDPGEVGSTESLFIAQDGCDSLVIESTLLHLLPFLNIESLHDYHGYDISCAGGDDGGAVALVFGLAPYTYEWSTFDDSQSIIGLAAGNYTVTITDGNGCMESGEITLLEPPVFTIAFEISEPGCFDSELGSISVIVTGGAAPFMYSLDGVNFQSSSEFNNLQNGIYMITALDANNCMTSEIISIHVPLSIQVDLGDDQEISFGDSATIQAVVNVPFDSIASLQWNGSDMFDCPSCLTQIVAPIITTAYSITVISTDGCEDKDSVNVILSKGHEIYVPNVFSPNGDGIYDLLSINARHGVKEISSFLIFDRWGNLVFEIDHVQPDDPAVLWDGRFNGEVLNSGVFTFKMDVKFKDGSGEVRYGNITLLR